jgi:uncharacterized protein
MRIAAYGASGMIGSRVVSEAVSRGHQVTGLTRSGGDLPDGVRAVRSDAGDPAAAKSIAASNDVVVSAIGPSRTGDDHREFLDALRTLVEVAGDTRLVVVGGAGSLLVDGTTAGRQSGLQSAVQGRVVDPVRSAGVLPLPGRRGRLDLRLAAPGDRAR